MWGQPPDWLAPRGRARTRRLGSSDVSTPLDARTGAWDPGSASRDRAVSTGDPLDCGLPSGWSTLPPVAWPGRRRATIGRLLIGPGGVLVLAVKHWPGEVSLEDGLLRHQGHAREKDVAAAADAGLALAGLVPAYAGCVQSIIVLDDRDGLSSQTRDVAVCGAGDLADLLDRLPPVLARGQILELRRHLLAHRRADPVVTSEAVGGPGPGDGGPADAGAGRPSVDADLSGDTVRAGGSIGERASARRTRWSRRRRGGHHAGTGRASVLQLVVKRLVLAVTLLSVVVVTPRMLDTTPFAPPTPSSSGPSCSTGMTTSTVCDGSATGARVYHAK